MNENIWNKDPENIDWKQDNSMMEAVRKQFIVLSFV